MAGKGGTRRQVAFRRASGEGIRLWKAGAVGADAPKIAVGSRTTPARPKPCPPPPRAKVGVDATTQAVANSTARTRFMTLTPLLRPASCPIIDQARHDA